MGSAERQIADDCVQLWPTDAHSSAREFREGWCEDLQ